jgi:hypothetical protein
MKEPSVIIHKPLLGKGLMRPEPKTVGALVMGKKGGPFLFAVFFSPDESDYFYVAKINFLTQNKFILILWNFSGPRQRSSPPDRTGVGRWARLGQFTVIRRIGYVEESAVGYNGFCSLGHFSSNGPGDFL